MVILTIGIILSIVGSLFIIAPSKGNLPFYGYRSPRAARSDEHWRLAQKTSGKYFLIFGLLMTSIGYLLKLTGHTNYFIVELLVLVFPIMPIFILTEKKLQDLDDEIGGNNNEHSND